MRYMKRRGRDDDGLKPRKRSNRPSPNQAFIDQCLALQPGEWFDVPIPRDRGVVREQRRVSRVLERRVRPEMLEYLYRLRLTAKRKLRISCHTRPQHGRLALRTD